MGMSIRVFLSYAISDKDLVEMFKSAVHNKQQDIVFMEHFENEDSEKKWKVNVLEKIKASDAVLGLFGHSTWESLPVKWEIEKAVEMGKKVAVAKLKPAVFMIPEYVTQNNLRVFDAATIDIFLQLKNG